MQRLKGDGAKLATVNFQMDNSDTRKLNRAKPYIVNRNETNLTPPLSRGKRTLVEVWVPLSLNDQAKQSAGK